jgi:hypothetical protein
MPNQCFPNLFGLLKLFGLFQPFGLLKLFGLFQPFGLLKLFGLFQPFGLLKLFGLFQPFGLFQSFMLREPNRLFQNPATSASFEDDRHGKWFTCWLETRAQFPKYTLQTMKVTKLTASVMWSFDGKSTINPSPE